MCFGFFYEFNNVVFGKELFVFVCVKYFGCFKEWFFEMEVIDVECGFVGVVFVEF